jgi:hypothetical protein
MRPRSFWSAVAIYGAMFFVLALAAWLLLSSLLGVGFRLEEVLQLIVLFLPAGLLMGLLMGWTLGPTTRTFGDEDPVAFRKRLEEPLHSLGYHLHNESSSQITYRRASIRPPLADIIVDLSASPIRVIGPRDTLGRLEKKLKKAKPQAG